MPPFPIDQLLTQALEHHQAGRLQQAEQFYRQILAQNPRHAPAIHLLGVIAHQIGRNDLAIEMIRQSLAIDPAAPEAHCNLASSLKSLGDLTDAIAEYREAIRLSPDYADAHNNLGIALKEQGQHDPAVAEFQHAIRAQPNFPKAYNNLASALRDQGRFAEADAAFRRAIAQDPAYADAHYNLGNLLRETRQFDAAIAAYREAISLSPTHALAHGNLGIVLCDIGQRDRGIAAYRRAIDLNPNLPEPHTNLGAALKNAGQLDEAITHLREAIRLDQSNTSLASAYSNLANALKDQADLDGAIAAYRDAIRLDPTLTVPHGNLVYTMYFHPDYTPRDIADELQTWTRRHADPLKKFILPHARPPMSDARLHIAYVAPDFREHCQTYFTLPLLENHNHESFKIYCYSSVQIPDAYTEKLQKLADVWRPVAGLTDADLAEQIRRDRIDILVDLTMHMAGGRPLLFARKPAPIQVAWLAYPGTTGLTTIDYRLTDPHLDPVGCDESVYSEKTLRLPDTFWCYDPLDGREVPVSPLPALESGKFTFGCLNNFCKVNPAVLDLWSKVLQKIPDSRLILLTNFGSHRQRTLDHFESNAIDPARIEFVPHQPHLDYMKLHHRIDLALDTFPYNGHTTSLDALWMGVPVVTLVGQAPVARAGLSQLTNLVLPELAAQTPEEFVQIAADLANDLPRLSDLRATLRPRMEKSPLMDAPKFAANMEAAYRQMWRNWCEVWGIA